MRLGLSLALTQPRGASGVVDIATLSWSGLWQSTFTASPWPGSASAGASSGRDLAEATTPPDALGGALGSYTPPNFNGTNDLLGTGAVVLSDLIANSCSGVVLFNADAASADAGAGSRLNNPQFLSDGNQILGVGFSSAGCHLAILDSVAGITECVVACATGGWHLMRWRVTDNALLEVGVDSGAMSSTSFAGKTIHPSRTLQCRVGPRGTGLAPFFDGRIALLGVSATALTDPQFVIVRTYVNARYGLSL